MTDKELLIELRKEREELLAIKSELESLRTSSKPSWQFMVKYNAKGGLFIQDRSVKELSAKTNKEYSPSLNIHGYQLRTFINLLEDEKLREAVLRSYKGCTEIKL